MIEVVGMVYRSTAFLRFLVNQLEDNGFPWRVVANDPNDEIVDALHSGRNVIIGGTYKDPYPTDYYLSRVYRCWNYCVETSKAEYVCLVNSDMGFSPGWLEALERRLDGKTIPCSRLVEPGYITKYNQMLTPGEHALEIDMGRNPDRFDFNAWHALAADLREDRVEPGGLYMPCVLHRETFLKVGGYPEGNLARPKNGDRMTQEMVTGDEYLFAKMASQGFKHVTCFDSLVYHMQEGEMSHIE